MTRRVAVIGLHGVGETAPGDMPKAIVQLLGLTEQFGHFTKHDLHIPVSATGLGVSTSHPEAERQNPFAGFSGVFRADLVPDGRDADVDFAKTLLENGQVSPAMYNTEIWSGQRIAPPEEVGTRVDVYEMFWSDLSHPATNSGLGVFGQFVQLLVHLASVGRISSETILARLYKDAGGAANAAAVPRIRLWLLFNWLNKSLYWLLSMPLLIGNLALALLALMFLAEAHVADLGATAPPELLLWRGLVYGAVAFILAIAGALWWLNQPPRALWRTALVCGAILLAAAFGWWISTGAVSFAPVLALAVLAVGDLLMRPYQRMRPGALGLWRGVAMAVVAVTVLESLKFGALPGSSPAASYWLAPLFVTAHALFLMLVGCWMLFCAALLLMCALGCVLHNIAALGAARAEIGRALRTCFLAALLPGPLFVAFVLGLFMVLRNQECDLLMRLMIQPSHHIIEAPVQMAADCKAAAACCAAAPCPPTALQGHDVSVYNAVGQWLDQSGTIAFLAYSLLIFSILVVATAALLPSIVSEILPLASWMRRFSGNDGLRGWLDGAFGMMALLAVVAFILVFPIVLLGAGWGWHGLWHRLWARGPEIIIPLGALSHGVAVQAERAGAWLEAHVALVRWLVTQLTPPVTWLAGLPAWALSNAGGKTVAATGGFLAGSKVLSARVSTLWSGFSSFFNRLRVVVDTAQDADNWLRERPQGDTVRFQVFARFASLLRHINGYHHGHYDEYATAPYDDIVILAYSQGCAVTADYLRFVQAFPHAVGARPHVNVRLLTLGCPLRQIYRQRFPMLYHWFNPAAPAATAATIGVERWHNVYGSGDYIGRDLWTAADPLGLVTEACIGPQAHTRYFTDPAAPEVAAALARWL
jgi:hypothetical protein